MRALPCDTADVYGNRGSSETQLGEILGPRPKDIVLATKFGMQMDQDGGKSGAGTSPKLWKRASSA